MAAEGGAIITFIFNGEDSEDIPRDITHLIIHESITVIPERQFYNHPNLVEVYCHAGVTKIEEYAFSGCPSLRRVNIPGVTIVDEAAFYNCGNLEYVECGNLERIQFSAFDSCEVLSIINLPSAKIVEGCAFYVCPAITEAIFGKDLDFIGSIAFKGCSSLESITIPLKNGLLTEDDVFKGCNNLERVYVVEGESLHYFADALLLESWSDDLNGALDSINQVLPNTDSGDGSYNNNGGKAIAIREWIEGVLRKVTHYRAAHQELLDEAATALQLFLPTDAVMNNVLPFVELPAHTFGGEDEAE